MKEEIKPFYVLSVSIDPERNSWQTHCFETLEDLLQGRLKFIGDLVRKEFTGDYGMIISKTFTEIYEQEDLGGGHISAKHVIVKDGKEYDIMGMVAIDETI